MSGHRLAVLVVVWLTTGAVVGVGLCLAVNAMWPRLSVQASLSVGNVCGLIGVLAGAAVAFWLMKRGRAS